MANPVGEESWLAYIEEETRRATDLEGRVKVAELYKSATLALPASLRIWLAYCEYFWSLFIDCQAPNPAWSADEQTVGRELFSFGSALSLWSNGYDAIRYRINDSHEFWNRWIAIEMDQLARSRNPVGTRRITHLFRDRLQIPHATWDETSQMFSSFLSTYNNAAYESEFQQVTASATEAKAAYELREPFELKINRAARDGDKELHRAVLRDYLDWEMVQIKKTKNARLAVDLCFGLYGRALTGVFAFDDDIWTNCSVYVSSLPGRANVVQAQLTLPNILDILQKATVHCPWSGVLWSRYILAAERVGLSFQQVESIKHAATNTKALDRDGMTGVLDMYAAWCGYLKRTAMNPDAHEDSADIAEVGLLAALEDVQLWGERLYKDEYKGDPNYRLERILTQFLTEVKGNIDEARATWERVSRKPVLADSYDFWLNYYLWEMVVYASIPKPRSPTPGTPAGATKMMRVPGLATDVLRRAVERRTIDWPERVMEVYLQHCNDYEQPATLQHAQDRVYKARKGVAKRRERESADAAAAYAAQVEAAKQQQHDQQQDVSNHASESHDIAMHDSPASTKRKRESTPEDHGASPKKARSADDTQQELKRDRENTTVLVTNLPAGATQTAIKKYFREYGHIKAIDTKKEVEPQSTSAIIEFSSAEEALSAQLRDNKYFEQSQIRVVAGTGLTLFVTNYPPTADESFIRDLFKGCGEIFGIRWPSLKFNTHRRFCYVSFSSPQAAQAATRLDGKVIDGKFTLLCKYSDPSQKKAREGAVAEGREVRVKNVQIATTEGDLKSVFGKYGKIASVRILKNMAGRSVGTVYIVYESAKDAENALQLDKTKFRQQILEVELSKETNYKPTATSRARVSSTSSPSPAPDDNSTGADKPGLQQLANQDPTPRELQERTLAIMNVPDTVNDARVRAIIEKHGAVTRLILRPDHQGAIVEFADATTAGRVALAVDGLEIIPGRKLQTGPVTELLKKKPEHKSNANNPENGKHASAPSNKKLAFMQPAQHIRRPVLGKPGPRRGVGFAAGPKTTQPSASAQSTENIKPKSNAEFKALFLGNGDNASPPKINGSMDSTANN
ncbi:squamous cell carcinoma antigen recognized by T-cells 3 [Microdochium nivale]|nr:squamous cell carcinoma antigen recognized by T-cells 3 [Microdochium nivale]